MNVLFVLQTEPFYDCRGKNKAEAFMNLEVQDENKNQHGVLKRECKLYIIPSYRATEPFPPAKVHQEFLKLTVIGFA